MFLNLIQGNEYNTNLYVGDLDQRVKVSTSSGKADPGLKWSVKELVKILIIVSHWSWMVKIVKNFG